MKLANKRIFIASDHAGVELKKLVCEHLLSRGIAPIDLGPATTESVDYPNYAAKLTQRLKQEPTSIGLLICGTGIGMSMAANRHTHIRAALCHNSDYARLAREHNDANVLVLGARFTPYVLAMEIVDVFLNTEFAGGRHSARVDKLG